MPRRVKYIPPGRQGPSRRRRAQQLPGPPATQARAPAEQAAAPSPVGQAPEGVGSSPQAQASVPASSAQRGTPPFRPLPGRPSPRTQALAVPSLGPELRRIALVAAVVFGVLVLLYFLLR
ncbi:MAG: hypothetical protein HYY31_04855 [Chloroflexi bacterium]|nr:hypothetical protein [Chloroflexota bacterium]